MGIINLPEFIVASILFIISPGIDTIFVLNRSITQGRRQGIYATLGIANGVLFHTTLAAFGLSLLLAQSAIAFSVIKYLGATYFLYLGISKLFAKDGIIRDGKTEKPVSSRQTYLSAVITNVLNPKVALFFLAFFPQFIQPTYIHNALPFIVLGAIYASMGFLWLLILVFFAGSFSAKLRSNPGIVSWLNKFSGIAFILMGVKIAFTKR